MITVLYLTLGRELEATVVKTWCWRCENKGRCWIQNVYKAKKTIITLSPGLPKYIDENDEPKYNGSQVGLPDFAPFQPQRFLLISGFCVHSTWSLSRILILHVDLKERKTEESEATPIHSVHSQPLTTKIIMVVALAHPG